jgi:hypothetical protein
MCEICRRPLASDIFTRAVTTYKGKSRVRNGVENHRNRGEQFTNAFPFNKPAGVKDKRIVGCALGPSSDGVTSEVAISYSVTNDTYTPTSFRTRLDK